ncbi:hypothetical protein JTB14_035587 [Gonioctena quinquepunctata]|nr:hypothetical protein JTB14_035587 [Gonioctena quinquepunctata]
MTKKMLTGKELEEILARSDDSDQEYEPLSSDDELSDTENLQNQHESVADVQSYILDSSQQNDVMEIDDSSSSIEQEELPSQGRFHWSTKEFSLMFTNLTNPVQAAKFKVLQHLSFLNIFYPRYNEVDGRGDQ